MCYSAQIKASYGKYVREFGAKISIYEFFELFWLRRTDSSIQIPKALEAEFTHPTSDRERDIKELIDWFTAGQRKRFDGELAKQRERLTVAQAKLALKVTKTAQEEVRKATNKIEWTRGKLDDLERTETRQKCWLPGTIAASSRSSQKTSMPGSTPIRRTLQPNMRSLMIACVRTTTTGLPARRAVLWMQRRYQRCSIVRGLPVVVAGGVQRLPGALQQQAIQRTLVLPGQVSELLGQGESDEEQSG